jgi:hypothetical protein
MGQAQQQLFEATVETASQEAREAATILINRNLFSSYYLGTLLEKTVRTRLGETGMHMPRNVRTRLQNRWDRYTGALGNLSSYRHTREAWLETLFRELGYEPLEEAQASDFKEEALPANSSHFLYRPDSKNPGNPNGVGNPNGADSDSTGADVIARKAEPFMASSVGPVTPSPDSMPHEDVARDESQRLAHDQSAPVESESAPLSLDAPEKDPDASSDHAVLISLYSWGTDFDRTFGSRARRGDMPHKLMERLLASGGPARWGILCNGRRIRLLKRDVVAGRQHYFEVDLEALFDNSNEQDAQRKERGFDTFWTLFRAQAFQPDKDGRCLLDVLDDESRKHAEGVSSRLKTSVFQAIEQLMSSLVSRADELLKRLPMDEPREQHRRYLAQQALNDLPALYTQSLVFLYRLLFILYAESRELLPVDNAVYRDSYSLNPLRDEIQQPGAERRYQPDEFRLWETLQALFRLIHRGCNTTQLVVPAYNGNLFDPQSTSFLQAIRIPDATLYRVLLQLSVTPPTKERGQDPIDYRDLGVEQLGAVYEGLLEFEPRVASEPMVEVRHKDVHVIIPQREQRDYKVERVIPEGAFYLGRGAGRKTSGSYYTPQPLVDFLVRRTLEPLVQQPIQNGEPERILELKVVDPAMGSGAFLVGACLYLADAYARAVRRQAQLLNGNNGIAGPQTLASALSGDPPPASSQADTPEQQDPETLHELAIASEEAAEVEVAIAEEEGELSEEATRPYRRLVAERCLYGVDLNLMAVELAKVSLWLTTLAGDKPLTFLDANLRCGNSLIGAPLHLAGHGQEDVYTIYTIHPEANKRLARARGDTISSRGSRRERDLWDTAAEEEEQQLTIYDELNDVRNTVPSLVDHRSLIAQQPSDTVAQVHEKATLFRRRVIENEKRAMLEDICNLWVASWFWKQPHKSMQPDEPGWVPPLDGLIYTELVNHIRQQYREGSGQFIKINPVPYLNEVWKIVKEVRPFHWELEFPEIYFEPDGRPRANPGFNAVLGNPPWDIVLQNYREFFSAYDPAFRELERVAAEQRQEELLKEIEIKEVWETYNRYLDSQISYFQLGEIYPYQSTVINGKHTNVHANTYKLFLERSFKLLRYNGVFGMIVPSGIYNDQGSAGLRQLFLNHAQINYLFCIENRRNVFPIDSRFKFVLLGIHRAETSHEFEAAFMLQDLDVLSSPERSTLSVPTELIHRFSPDTLSMMEFRSQQDVNIVTRIYDSWPLLGENKEDVWFIDLAREFHMTDDRYLFNEKHDGWPLYEGKTLHQYTHSYSNPRYWVEPAKGREELARLEIQRVEEALDTLAIKLSRIRKVGTRKERVKALLAAYGRGSLTIDDVRIAPDAPRLAFRDIAASTNERTMIATILPSEVFAGNTLFYVTPWRFNAQKAITNTTDIICCYNYLLDHNVTAYLCGIFNSFTLDYILRFKVTVHVNMFYVYQLPVPRLTPDDVHCRAIAQRVARLVCVGPEFDELRRELLGDVNAHIATIQDERQRLQNEIDALVAHLYGLDENDLRHILYAPYTFPLVKQEIKDGVMRQFGRVGELLT